jgi:CHASE3 domain sensor protein
VPSGRYERWQYSECLKPYRPASARRWCLSLWILAVPLFLVLLWQYFYGLPMLTEVARKEAQEKQQVLHRIEKLEKRMKQLESRK